MTEAFKRGFLDQLKYNGVSAGNAELLYKRAFLDAPEDDEQKKRNRKKLIIALSALAGAATLGGIAGTYGAFKNPTKELSDASSKHSQQLSEARKDQDVKERDLEKARRTWLDTDLKDPGYKDVAKRWNDAGIDAQYAQRRVSDLLANKPQMRELNKSDLLNGALFGLLGIPAGGALGALGGHMTNKLNDYVDVTPYAINIRSDDAKKKKKKNK